MPRSLWARTAIDYVGATYDWMRDGKAAADGTYAFRPDALESRRLFARALFRAFGAGSAPNASSSFPDLPSDDRFYRFADAAVSAGWMQTDADGAFRPTQAVTTREVHRALVLAIGSTSATALVSKHWRRR